MRNVSLRGSTAGLRLAAVLAIGFGLSAGLSGASTTATATTPEAGAIDGPVLVEEAATVETYAAPVVVESGGARFAAAAWSADEVAGIDRRVFSLALGAARCATSKGAVVDPSTLTIIDYSKPSTEPRMWVLDLEDRSLVYEELVAHGQGSGGNFATQFSNRPDSHQTSLGLFVTESTYVGRNGYSLKLEGLEPGFNDRARERAIVMHGAPYVNTQISKGLGRLGRSHGCPAVREPIARELIDRVKGGSLVFAYYPDAEWLEHSEFLSNCTS